MLVCLPHTPAPDLGKPTHTLIYCWMPKPLLQGTNVQVVSPQPPPPVWFREFIVLTLGAISLHSYGIHTSFLMIEHSLC